MHDRREGVDMSEETKKARRERLERDARKANPIPALVELHELTEYDREILEYIRRTRCEVSIVCRSVSRSGMSRVLSLYIVKGGEIVGISALAGKLLGERRADGWSYNAITVRGCGMDMGFATVYNLGRVLFPKGYRLRKNDHRRNGSQEKNDCDGGYSLRHRWM